MAKKRSPSSLWQKHSNLKWLLPLMALVVAGFLLVHHHLEEEMLGAAENNPLKDKMRQVLNLPGDNVTNGQTTQSTPPAMQKSY